MVNTMKLQRTGVTVGGASGADAASNAFAHRLVRDAVALYDAAHVAASEAAAAAGEAAAAKRGCAAQRAAQALASRRLAEAEALAQRADAAVEKARRLAPESTDWSALADHVACGRRFLAWAAAQ